MGGMGLSMVPAAFTKAVNNFVAVKMQLQAQGPLVKVSAVQTAMESMH
jgi:hypothetical protein